MTAGNLLLLFVAFRLLQHAFERYLGRLNRAYYLDPTLQEKARVTLGISEAGMSKALAYTEDKYRLGFVQTWVQIVVVLTFLAMGGLGVLEEVARTAATRLEGGDIVTGLVFFGLVALASMVVALPFDWFRTFRLEQKHGFNRQTPRGFVLDRVKGLVLGALLGGSMLAAILWIMERMGDKWWVYAWLALTAFSFLTAWLYPTLLAPLFNKFSPIADGELRDKIYDLAARVGFKAAGIFVMDASKRSSHGNAYFTGVLGEKRIVLFDTLVQAMAPREVVAVLAHELGHFKLHHVRWALIRGTIMSALTFYLLGRALPLAPFYEAFGLAGVSNYGALLVFGMWFGLLDFVLSPLENHLSRRNEFAADRFAREYGGSSGDLGSALLKLRETSHAMPLTHPLYSWVYYSHPPILERLSAMGYAAPKPVT